MMHCATIVSMRSAKPALACLHKRLKSAPATHRAVKLMLVSGSSTADHSTAQLMEQQEKTMTKSQVAELFDASLVNARIAAYDRAVENDKRHGQAASLDRILGNAKKIEDYLINGTAPDS